MQCKQQLGGIATIACNYIYISKIYYLKGKKMPRLTQKEKLYCFYMGIIEEKNKKGNYYMRIVGENEKAPNSMPFKILLRL